MRRGKKATAKRKSVGRAPKKTKVVDGQKFTRVSCHTTKTAAKKKAESIRNSGYNARVEGKCVLKGRKKRTTKKKTTKRKRA